MHEGSNYPYVVTIASEKGGVGKTTVATNLAVYLKALAEDVPVTILSLDNHCTVERMFSLNAAGGAGVDQLLGEQGILAPELGQYGVQYYRSSRDLDSLKERFKNPFTLTERLAQAGLSGIVIIDTRPVLDCFSENALFAADFAIVPVKDGASLENCRNIFGLFDRRGVDSSALNLLPCLVDARIKYQGPFPDLKALLFAFAKSRGYRCLDLVLSKSPRVESLSTNPEGKVYPVLTHGRGTELHGQLQQLAQLVLGRFSATTACKSEAYALWRQDRVRQQEIEFQERLARLVPHCPWCGCAIDGTEVSYYAECNNGTGTFLHDHCLEQMVRGCLMGADQFLGETATWRSLRTAFLGRSYLVRQKGETGIAVACLARDGAVQEEGSCLELPEGLGAQLVKLLQSGEIVIVPGGSKNEILAAAGYHTFSQLKKSILERTGFTPVQHHAEVA